MPPQKQSRFAAEFAAALGEPDQIAEHGISELALALHNEFLREQGGKLEDHLRLPWMELQRSLEDGDQTGALSAATEFLLALEWDFALVAPETAGESPASDSQSGSPNDSSVGTDSVTISRS